MSIKCAFVLLSYFGIIAVISALPVINNVKSESQAPADSIEVQSALEYNRYLEEIVLALEDDPTFRKKLDQASKADIENGNIAQELEYVDHHVRTKLDEIKRREIERLRSLAKLQFEKSNDIERDHVKKTDTSHIDHENEHTFEIEDLRKLIKKTSEDLAKADQKRREEFKKYEMQKEYEHEMHKKGMSEDEIKKYENELKEQEEKHKVHEKVHQPGNKVQLEEVWEKQDHMEGQMFEPHSFFAIHDVDGNGFWDETEVKALFIKELDKVYQSGVPEDDMRERAEEMERMREYVFQQTDTNHDGLISFDEFLEQTKRDEFQNDKEWNTLDKQTQYTHEEFLEFQRQQEQHQQQQQQQHQQQQQQQQHHQQQQQHQQQQHQQQKPAHV